MVFRCDFVWLIWPGIIRLAEVPPKGGILSAILSLRFFHDGVTWQCPPTEVPSEEGVLLVGPSIEVLPGGGILAMGCVWVCGVG